MRKRILDLRDDKPLLDIAAYARNGRLPTPAERLHITLTVHRAPEVMVKVSGGARTLSGVERHMAYIGRNGDLGLGIDANGQVAGKGFERDVVRDWNLDVDARQNHTRNSATPKKPPKLVHNIIFSMPPGTSPRAVLKAVETLALNEWALQHRYAMALHTDDDHPHVHVVLKAISEQGARLNIRKATLRGWRRQFATNLRDLGVDANATERAVRGQILTRKSDGIFRANLRGQSTFVERRRQRVAERLMAGALETVAQIKPFRATRSAVSAGWHALAMAFSANGDREFAEAIRSFHARMPRLETDDQQLAAQMTRSRHSERESREPPTTV